MSGRFTSDYWLYTAAAPGYVTRHCLHRPWRDHGSTWHAPTRRRSTPAALVRNHAFIDGGYRFHASEEAAAQAVIGLAAGHLDEHGYASFLRANSTATHPPQL